MAATTLVFLIFLTIMVSCTRSDSSFDELFTIARDSYLLNDWQNCVEYMERALTAYHQVQGNVTACKIRCRKMAKEEPPLGLENVENLHYYEEAIRTTLCIMRCKAKVFGEDGDRLDRVPKKIMDDFLTRTTYDYLQLCYYQTGDFQKAASAAFTNLVRNPHNEVMRDNLEYYLKQSGTDETRLLDYEGHEFVPEFRAGVEHYRLERWSQVREHMEKSIVLYLEAEEECRFACERPFDMGWFPDFIMAVANHFTFCLRCKRNCQVELSNVDGKQVDGLLPLMYHYLQISYYWLQDLRNAAECVESYLLFRPHDAEMKANKEFYLSSTDTPEAWFVARQEARSYVYREQYETKLLEFIKENFDFDQENANDEVVPPSPTPPSPKDEL